MDLQDLSPDEQDLCASIADGKQVSLASGVRIDARVLRHIVLGLPFKKEAGVFKSLVRTLRGCKDEIAPCSRTPVGISIKGGAVHGRLDIASAIGDGGGPVCPLEFSKTAFESGPDGAVGFSGANAHLSRLSFNQCTFAVEGNPVDTDSGRPIPVIDLSGARLDGRLDMDGIRPAPEKDGLLWVHAPEVRVGGGINLSRCTLRAPAALAEEGKEERAEDALDLTQAEIRGDLMFLDGSRVTGRLKLRGVRIEGDLWLSGAKIRNPGGDESVFLQGARIGGLLVMNRRRDGPGDKGPARTFGCLGGIDLTAAEVGRSLILKDALVDGGIKAEDLIVRDDLFLHARVNGIVDLEHMTIGGSLDISNLRIEKVKAVPAAKGGASTLPWVDAKPVLSLKDGSIGRALRLRPDRSSPRARFFVNGTVDLTGLSCDTLDDDIGRRWGRKAGVRMNHFTYHRTGWLSEERAEAGLRRRGKPTYRIVSDWIQSRRADGLFPWRFFPWWLLARDEHFWEPWQLRRNWIYQHYRVRREAATADPFVSIIRHRIREQDYRPQPFEQAIKVARAEGREDSANQVEMHKQRLEWRFFNQRVRWALGIVAIILSALWLSIKSSTDGAMLATGGAALIALVLMIWGSSIRRLARKRVVAPLLSPRFPESAHAAFVILSLPLWFFLSGPGARIVEVLLAAYAAVWVVIAGSSIAAGAAGPLAPARNVVRAANMSSKLLTWIAYYVPAIALFFLCGWYDRPFHYIVAFLIFVAIRLTTVFAHAVMRFGFGYMRRPIYAVTTLIVAFIVGWWGVHFANQRGMLVIDAQPVADLAMPDNHAEFPAGHRGEGTTPILMGSRQVPGGEGYVRELPCGATISEALYALDVLIPIIDLREERSCEIRRVAAPAGEGGHGQGRAEHARREPEPGDMSFGELWAAFPELAFDNHRFWWWVKAIYALFGWIIVSLSILTFAQVNKIHAEPPTEHK